MRRLNLAETSQIEVGQFIKTVGATGTPEALRPGVKEVFTVQTVADVSSALAGKYFDLADANGSVRVYITVGGVGVVPPNPVHGRTLVVDIVANDTAGSVATAVKVVLDADAQLVASVVSDTVTVTQASVGIRQSPVAGTSGFTVTQTVAGVDKRKLVASVSFTGKKARGTANSGMVYLGVSATNDTQLFEIAPGQTVVMRAPQGASIDLALFYLDVATNSDGVVVNYPALEVFQAPVA